MGRGRDVVLKAEPGGRSGRAWPSRPGWSTAFSSFDSNRNTAPGRRWASTRRPPGRLAAARPPEPAKFRLPASRRNCARAGLVEAAATSKAPGQARLGYSPACARAVEHRRAALFGPVSWSCPVRRRCVRRRPGSRTRARIHRRSPAPARSAQQRAPSPRALPAPGSLVPGPGGAILPVCMSAARRTARAVSSAASRRAPRGGASGGGRCSMGAWPRSRSGICCLRCCCLVRVRSRCGGGRPGPVRWDLRGSRCRAGTRW